ncbi:MAG: hypothetical protein V4659_13805 [Pseudomonadota bacterium]
MSGHDLIGLAGVALILIAYALTVAGRLDAQQPAALLLNLGGALLILVSLTRDFNLSAVVMESAWAAVALFGLARLAFKRPGRG